MVKNLPDHVGDTGDASSIPGMGSLTPVFLPGNSYVQRSLAGDSPRGHKEWDTTEVQS